MMGLSATVAAHNAQGPEPVGALSVSRSGRGSAVLANTGDQPGLVFTLQTLQAPAFAEGFALVETRGLGQTTEGQGGNGLVGLVIQPIELHFQIIDVGGLETVAQAGTLLLQEAGHLRSEELGDLLHLVGIPVLLQGQEMLTSLLDET